MLATGVASATRLTEAQCVNAAVVSSPVVAVKGTTPPSVLASYGVLRRPQAPSDVLPAGDDFLLKGLAGALASYDPTETRLLERTSTLSMYMIVGVMAGSPLPAGCARVAPAIWRFERCLSTFRGSGPGFSIVEVAASSDDGVSEGPTSSFALNADGFQFSSVLLIPASSAAVTTYVAQLVPDGVGAVQFGFEPSIGAATVSVQNNLAFGPSPVSLPIDSTSIDGILVFTPAQRRQRLEMLPTSITWLADPGSAAVRTIPRPPRLVSQLLQLAALDKPNLF
jgi:hypothetical protein